MLSVLSSGTLQLTGELREARLENNRLVSVKMHALDLEGRRKRGFHLHVAKAVRMQASREDHYLKRMVFLIFLGQRTHTQVSNRRKGAAAAHDRRSAWLWLWRRKLLCLWRRAAVLSHKETLAANCLREVLAHKNEATEAAQTLSVNYRAVGDVEELVERETARSAELQAALQEAVAQVAELKATLKKTYLAQFEEKDKLQNIEQKYSALVGEMQLMRNEEKRLLEELDEKRKEIAESKDLHRSLENSLQEASEKCSMAEGAIDDIISSKCSPTQRFFEKYNLPGVLLSFFRKTLELHSQLRSKTGLHRQSSISSLGSNPSSPSPTKNSAAASVLADVRSALGVNKDGEVTRHKLQSFLEGLQLTQVSPSMATQVLLALLDLDLGVVPCDISRFATVLASPPAWETSELAKRLWDSHHAMALGCARRLWDSPAVVLQSRSSTKTSAKKMPLHEDGLFMKTGALPVRAKTSSGVCALTWSTPLSPTHSGHLEYSPSVDFFNGRLA